mmetsp:Transcript_56385/g.121926  ORF Transcript_56385/g.121926 Transcript_56385/m.121926 type:complete len:110 (-) Transcript_56385:231-560(-)
MVVSPQTAIFDDYLEKKLRALLEAMVDGLLRDKPSDIDAFCLNWLVDWHRQHDPSDREELQSLTAERDALLARRNKLRDELLAAGQVLPAAEVKVPQDEETTEPEAASA